jgi:indolepyruvate ferredoxin oxidoreductase
MFMLGYAWQQGLVPVSQAAILRAIELNALSVSTNTQAFIWGRHAANDLPEVMRLAVANGMHAQDAPQVIEFKRAPTLDETIKTRVAFLSAYQNAAYAERYRGFVMQVAAAEAAVPDGPKAQPLTAAVARYLFKLMAYKDEYEVARLHADAAFSKKIAGMFEGDYRLKFHLAPPLFAKRDGRGHLIKQEFGGWMMQAFRIMSRFKFLRGSMLDPFGHTEERRQERALIEEYRKTVAALLPLLRADNVALAAEIARIPELIRGYGHVKQAHLADAAARREALLAAFHAAGAPAPGIGARQAA